MTAAKPSSEEAVIEALASQGKLTNAEIATTTGVGRSTVGKTLEIIVLHDADAEKSLVIVFFENEEDYRRGDEVLSAMPAGDTPGQRTAVAKYHVAIRMTV
jgi:hypothetical protein